MTEDDRTTTLISVTVDDGELWYGMMSMRDDDAVLAYCSRLSGTGTSRAQPPRHLMVDATCVKPATVAVVVQ